MGDNPGGGVVAAAGGSGGRGGDGGGRRPPGDGDGNARRPSSNANGGKKGKKRKVYGKPGSIHCYVCDAYRDHPSRACPGNCCRRCGSRDHWVRECNATFCDWCQEAGHVMAECTNGGSFYLSGTKRPIENVAEPRSGVAKVARPSSTTAPGRSYVQAAKPAPGGKAPVSYASVAKTSVNVRPSDDRPEFFTKVTDFLSDVQSLSSLTSAEEIQRRRDAFAERRRMAEVRYRRELALINQDEAQLDLEVANENAFRECIDRLASVQQAILAGARGAGMKSLSVANASVGETVPQYVTPVVRSETGHSEEPRVAAQSKPAPVRAQAQTEVPAQAGNANNANVEESTETRQSILQQAQFLYRDVRLLERSHVNVNEARPGGAVMGEGEGQLSADAEPDPVLQAGNEPMDEDTLLAPAEEGEGDDSGDDKLCGKMFESDGSL